MRLEVVGNSESSGKLDEISKKGSDEQSKEYIDRGDSLPVHVR